MSTPTLLRNVAALAALAAAASWLSGCSDPAGIMRIHFALRPPAVVDFGAQSPPPLDPLAVARAEGTVEAMPPADQLTTELHGLPTPSSVHIAYRLWLSASEEGSGWTRAAEVQLPPSGAVSVQIAQANVAIDLASVRSAMLTLDSVHEQGPSATVILAGSVGQSAGAQAPAYDAGGAVGHMH